MAAELKRLQDDSARSGDADGRRLKEIETRIGKARDLLLHGFDSEAIRDELRHLEKEKRQVEARLADLIALANRQVQLPDDDWIRDRIEDFAKMARDETPAALMLQSLFGRVEVDAAIEELIPWLPSDRLAILSLPLVHGERRAQAQSKGNPLLPVAELVIW